MKCKNCNWTGHTKSNAGERWRLRRSISWMVERQTRLTHLQHYKNSHRHIDTPIVWTYGYTGRMDICLQIWLQLYMSVQLRRCNHVPSIHQKSRHQGFQHNRVKGLGEGDIVADLKFQGKLLGSDLHRSCMYWHRWEDLIPQSLRSKGFECHIFWGQVHIMKNAETYSKATLGSELYEVKMKIIPSEQNVLSAVKRDSPATDLPTWHRWLGQLGTPYWKNSSAPRSF